MTDQPNTPDEINYTVMPSVSKKYTMPAEEQQQKITTPHEAKPLNMRKWIKIGGAVILIVLLGLLAYYLATQKNNNSEKTTESKLPRIWLNQHFGSETCTDAAKCGDEADPDNDGLKNYNEFKEGTNPNKADSDEDGLADGDEVNVYKTDPGLKYTDRREIAVVKDFNDAVDISSDFDPLTPGFKMTSTRLQQVDNDAKTFGLHEPTITTLKNLRGNGSSINSKTLSVFIEAGKFNPDKITVNKGDTVVWLNKDSTKHKVMSSAFQSPELETNQTFSFTFQVAGGFQYEDQLNSLIKGTVEVK